jgi:capsular polysaccharide export protein
MRPHIDRQQTSESMKEKKVVLFLQGPHSVFFACLAGQLEQLGHRCRRINLCFSDWLFWRRPGADNYRGRLEDWPDYLEHYVARHAVTDIVLLGEQRSHHRVAVELAAKNNIHVTVTEWGYLRPDWITFERDGMSGNTRFPRDRAEIFALARGVPPPDFTSRYPEPFLRLAGNGLAGDVGNWLLRPLYPGYQPHISDNPITLYAGTGLRIAKSKLREGSTKSEVQRLREQSTRRPYFVFPMQIEADYQVRAYSPYSGLEEALEEAIASFARCSAASTLLVIKLHPMDPGRKAWRKIIARLAARQGVSSRVIFIDGGCFASLADRSAGIVTVNSTTGVTALKLGRPVKTLGQAIYDVPGLTHQGNLDSFWRAPATPDPAFCDAFVRAISACIQIKGGFFSKKGVEAAVDAAAARLSESRVNHPYLGHRVATSDSAHKKAHTDLLSATKA